MLGWGRTGYRPSGGGLGSDSTHRTVSRLLAELEGGDPAVMDQLFTCLYDELRQLARRQRQRWRDDYTLNTTALLHEAYLKLIDRDEIAVDNRAHFLALAARAMRHILCNYARDRRALKRGGGMVRLSLNDATVRAAATSWQDDSADALVALDEALKRLEQIDPRQSSVVECRFFGGLTVAETAQALGISARTVKRDWALAQAWLHRETAAGS
jgi:RNA polymerase sigma factor (TIGR02999 family)